MVITQTPFRMSFFGGGSDFPEYFRENGGSVLSTTFDKYCYVTVRHLPRFFEYKTHLTYSATEHVNDNSEIKHPAIREAMKMLDMHELRLTYDSDLPARSGLGTSSSFAVGMLNAFYALKGKYADKKKLADEAICLEREKCDEAGGWQDQIAAAYGGFNRIDFSGDDYTVRPVIISPARKEELCGNLMLFFTGFSRFSADIQNDTRKQVTQKKADVGEMVKLVGDAERILTGKGALDAFGQLLDYTWHLKRGLSKGISTDGIDAVYEKAKAAGATGGKLLGAGGGGFLLFYVEKEKQSAVMAALSGLLHVPFDFEDGGSKVIHYAPEFFTLETGF
ncbi:MAG: kinase [Oscillospiraceae bacterium]